jgi:hypothetical protein
MAVFGIGRDMHKMADRSVAFTNRDRILCIPFCLSGLLCFALILAYWDTREIRLVVFGVSLLICVTSLVISDNKKRLVLGLAAFIGLRLLWSLLVTVFR